MVWVPENAGWMGLMVFKGVQETIDSSRCSKVFLFFDSLRSSK